MALSAVAAARAAVPGLPGRLEDNLPYLLARAAVAANAPLDRKMHAQFGLSAGGWRAVLALRDRGEAQVTVLARIALLEQPTMTKLLDRLARDLLAKRGQDNGDRRVVVVRLTDEGRALAECVAAVAAGHEAEVLAQHPSLADPSVREALIAVPAVRVPT